MSKSRGWQFTIFFKNSAELTSWKLNLEAMNCTWLTVQTESAGTTGRKHLQGCVWFPTPRTMAGTKKRFWKPTVHLEAARGTPAENNAYCTKEDTRIKDGTHAYQFSKGGLSFHAHFGQMNWD